MKIEIVSATRLSEAEFWEKSPLGISFRRLQADQRFAPPQIAFLNVKGLPEIYNARILNQRGGDLLIFIHDDVWIDDHFLSRRVLDGLNQYDVIGVAGSRRRVKNQPAWLFADARRILDDSAYLSGVVAHGDYPFGALSVFGDTPADCELLDGVFLAAKKSTLLASKTFFDPQFDFEFYDLDFCRTARMNQLRLGTWPIAMTHQSGGGFGSEGWNEKYRLYFDKWGD